MIRYDWTFEYKNFFIQSLSPSLSLSISISLSLSLSISLYLSLSVYVFVPCHAPNINSQLKINK
jgi:hypothetical protein